MNSAVITVGERTLRYAISGLVLLFVALALIGGVRGYSPVPFWDMWESYVPFLDKAANGDWSVWWAQHNEHRVVLARLFFWADLRWFHGAGWFLILVNYILVAIGAVLFCRILREVEVPQRRATDMQALTAFLVICLFFWSQHENLTWGFQSQFILAQLLPIAALYALYRSMPGRSAMFALACALGVLSVGTMANGILALPLMAAYALLTRQGARRVGVLAALAVLMLLAYFHGYQAPSGHGSLSQALREQPVNFVRYVLIYIGSPLHYVFGAKPFGKLMAQLAGIFFIASSLRFALPALRNPRQSSLQLALLFFIAYIVGTAIGTAGGRLIFGLEQGLSMRYTTPALMAWAALIVLYAPTVLALQGRRRLQVWGVLGLLMLGMLNFQLQARHSRAEEMFGRSTAALAIELRVKDQSAIGSVFPDLRVLGLTEQAADKQRSVFGLYPYRGARSQMGAVFAAPELPACQAYVDLAEMVHGDDRYLRVDGWLYDPAGKNVPRVVRFLDAENKQIGYAVGGHARDDLAGIFGKEALLAGYRGYLSAAPHGSTLVMQGEGRGGAFCRLQVKAPTPISVTPETPSAQRATVGSGNVLEGNQWLGADFDKSQFAGMKVYGSFIGSDGDRGVISLRVKRGDRLFYRSGPSANQQTIEVNGARTMALPLSKDWMLLEFSGESWPQEPFTVKLTDNGSGWGEWSAVALQSN